MPRVAIGTRSGGSSWSNSAPRSSRPRANVPPACRPGPVPAIRRGELRLPLGLPDPLRDDAEAPGLLRVRRRREPAGQPQVKNSTTSETTSAAKNRPELRADPGPEHASRSRRSRYQIASVQRSIADAGEEQEHRDHDDGEADPDPAQHRPPSRRGAVVGAAGGGAAGLVRRRLRRTSSAAPARRRRMGVGSWRVGLVRRSLSGRSPRRSSPGRPSSSGSPSGGRRRGRPGSSSSPAARPAVARGGACGLPPGPAGAPAPA